MEEILASIRKIIAEDPPGSRPMPEPARESAPRAAPARDPFAAAFAAKPAAQEPVKAADPFAGLGRSSAMSNLKGTGLETRTSPADASPSLQAPLHQGAAPQPATQRTRPTDIEDQMAEILGLSARRPEGAAKTEGARAAPVASAVPVAQASVQAALDSLTAPVPATDAKKDVRSGFTHARDGYIPGAPGFSPAAATPGAPAHDPFEFALGPSPFARAKSAEAEHGVQERNSSAIDQLADLGAVIPERMIGAETRAGPAIETSPIVHPAPATRFEPWPPEAKPVETSTAVDSVPPKAAAEFKVVEEAKVEPAPAPHVVAAEVRPAAPVSAAPVTVAAPLAEDLAPTVIKTDPIEALRAAAPVSAEVESGNAAGIAPSIDVAAGNAAQPPIATSHLIATGATSLDRLLSGLADVTATPATPAPIASIETTPPAQAQVEVNGGAAVAPDPVATPASAIADTDVEGPRATGMFEAPLMVPSRALSRVSLADEMAMQTRTMEDTVAELLRPMLRSWLAENMPKIVERALRKEFDDGIQSDHKTAAE